MARSRTSPSRRHRFRVKLPVSVRTPIRFAPRDSRSKPITGRSLDGRWERWPRLRPTFEDAPVQPVLIGNRVPQVPSYQLGVSATYVDPRGFTGALQARRVGAQFDDDLNVFELESFGVIDVSASQSCGGACTSSCQSRILPIPTTTSAGRRYAQLAGPGQLGWDCGCSCRSWSLVALADTL